MNRAMVSPGIADHEDKDAASVRDAEPRRRSPRPPPSPRSRRRLAAVLAVLTLAALAIARPASRHVRAAELLSTFSSEGEAEATTEHETTFEVPATWDAAGAIARPARTVRAHVYTPRGVTSDAAPALVLVHGVQYRGIDEPRLKRFARSLVSAGLVVMTPQVDELADYHVAESAIDTVGAATRALRTSRGGARRVGLVGTSFGGGVALLAAADPRFAGDVGFAVAVGAHDDLERVSRFFATDEIAQVSGETQKLRAHAYGAIVLAYTHASDFFDAEDLPVAREALRLWLHEERDAARVAATRLSPGAQEKMRHFFDEDVAAFRPALLAMIERRKGDMRAVSPGEHLAGLRAPVYLLHGSGDTVVPASETAWLARHVPEASLGAVLVSPAIVHVELHEPTLWDKWQLVHFMGQVIGAADDMR